MRLQPFFAVLLSTTLFSGLSAAQNYVPAKSYNNPDVVVNMDVIGASNAPLRPAPIVQPPAPMAIAPVLNRPLPPLRPPQAMPQMASRAPMPLMAPETATAPQIPPVPQAAMEAPPPLAKMPPPPALTGSNFTAREMALRAPAAPVASNLAPVPVIQEMKAETAPAAPAAKNPARELLAAAREEAAEEPAAAAETDKPRDVVIFDEPPVMPKPQEKLDEPKAVVEEDTPMALAPPAVVKEIVPVEKPAPVLAPAPVTEAKTETETLTAPPIEASAPPAMPEKFETAALNPAPLDAAGNQATRATLVDDFEAYRLTFGAQSAELAPSETAVLDKIAAKLKKEERTRLQLRAYADGTPDTASVARRLSLSRALNVRSYLTEKGIPSSRLDVRALGLGNAAMGDAVNRGTLPADRVDVIFVR